MSNLPAVSDQRPNLLSGNRPQAIVPTSMDEAYRLGKAICISGMAPRGMETPEKCMIAIMRGMEVGLTPMQALDKIAVVNGRPTIWGDGAMALVRGSGLCEFVDEEISGEGDNRTATCEAKRKGEGKPITRRFSVGDARKAGLWNKSGPWQQYPDRMLQMRARAFALRDLFADVLGGLYLREEIEEDRPNRAGAAPPPPAAVLEAAGETAERAPPRDEPQDAEFSEQSTAETHVDKPADHHPSQEVQEQAKPAGDAGPAPAPEPSKPDDETEDPEALLQEVREVFEACSTAPFVDEAHEMFADRVEASLDRNQRERYADLHLQALARFEKAGAEDAPGTTEPSPADAYRAEFEALLKREDLTWKDLLQRWSDDAPRRAEAIPDEGERAALRDRLLKRQKDLEAPTASQAAEEKPAPATAETKADVASPAQADDDAAFLDQFKTHIDTLPDRATVDAYVAETLSRRNKIGEKDEAAKEAFRDAVRRARGKFGAQK